MTRRRSSSRILVVLLLLAAASWWFQHGSFHDDAQEGQLPTALAPFDGICLEVHDGDTISIETTAPRHERHRIRIFGIDAPEQDQPYGKASRSMATRMVLGQAVYVEPLEIDRYGRPVARISFDGQDLGVALVRAGAAWHYRRYSNDHDLAAAEREARNRSHGLWASPDPVPPWDWRAKGRNRHRPLVSR